jgi:hypothetical protein
MYTLRVIRKFVILCFRIHSSLRLAWTGGRLSMRGSLSDHFRASHYVCTLGWLLECSVFYHEFWCSSVWRCFFVMLWGPNFFKWLWTAFRSLTSPSKQIFSIVNAFNFNYLNELSESDNQRLSNSRLKLKNEITIFEQLEFDYNRVDVTYHQ